MKAFAVERDNADERRQCLTGLVLIIECYQRYRSPRRRAAESTWAHRDQARLAGNRHILAHFWAGSLSSHNDQKEVGHADHRSR
jgi:hypothetical protein